MFKTGMVFIDLFPNAQVLYISELKQENISPVSCKENIPGNAEV